MDNPIDSTVNLVHALRQACKHPCKVSVNDVEIHQVAKQQSAQDNLIDALYAFDLAGVEFRSAK